MSEDSLEEILKEFEEELEEISVAANAGNYETPNAFTGGKSKFEKRRKQGATKSTGYKLVKKKKKKPNSLGENMKHSEIIAEIFGLNYKDFKGDDSKNPKQKVNGAIKEINRKLFEIDRIINRASKLKQEAGVGRDSYWKSTGPRMTKIAERLIKVSQKLRELAS